MLATTTLEATFAPTPQAKPGQGQLPEISEDDKRVVYAALLHVGIFTHEELARAREVHPRTVYKWVDKVEQRDDSFANEFRRLVGRG